MRGLFSDSQPNLRCVCLSKENLQRMLHVIGQFRKGINMNFDLDECKIIHMVKGKVMKGHPEYVVGGEKVIESLDMLSRVGVVENEYLVFLFQMNQIKGTIKNIYGKRLEKILKTKCNAGNKTNTINSWAIHEITYSLDIINWSEIDIPNIMRSIRALLSKFNSHHLRSAVECLVLPRECEGILLIFIEAK